MAIGSLSMPVQMYLLAYDTVKPRLTARLQLPYVVRAAALTELVQRGLLSERDAAVLPVLDARTGDAVLDGLLDLIQESRPRGWRDWAAARAGVTLDAVRRELTASGYLHGVRQRALWVFPYTDYVLDRPDFVDSLRTELLPALHGNGPLDEVSVRDAALIALAGEGGLHTLVSAGERRTYRRRIEQLAERSGDAEPAAPHLVHEVRRSMVQAIASVSAAM